MVANSRANPIRITDMERLGNFLAKKIAKRQPLLPKDLTRLYRTIGRALRQLLQKSSLDENLTPGEVIYFHSAHLFDDLLCLCSKEQVQIESGAVILLKATITYLIEIMATEAPDPSEGTALTLSEQYAHSIPFDSVSVEEEANIVGSTDTETIRSCTPKNIFLVEERTPDTIERHRRTQRPGRKPVNQAEQADKENNNWLRKRSVETPCSPKRISCKMMLRMPSTERKSQRIAARRWADAGLELNESKVTSTNDRVRNSQKLKSVNYCKYT